jgi:hypothetical protein
VRRLAGEQRALKDLAENMQRNLDENKDVLGRMDRIVEEMDQIVRDMEGGHLGEETVRNEERILSRLLDAQRSIHKRDYEKRRTSTTAENLFSIGQGADNSRNASQKLREEIRRAMLLKAPGEFEDLIKLYFRALAEEAPPDRGEQ